jgi:hypothetical protein
METGVNQVGLRTNVSCQCLLSLSLVNERLRALSVLLRLSMARLLFLRI